MDNGIEPTEVAKPLSRRKRVAFALVVTLMLAFVLEAGARLLFFIGDGMNPYYLAYGFVADIEHHSDEQLGYTKFQPSSIKHQMVDGEVVEVQINSDGFRSLNNFAKPKPAGVFRVVSLGASSTFGYHNADDTTYPVLLQRLLQQKLPDTTVEVLNLGIPHLRMEHIVALARSELSTLEPDVVTLYAGYNNSVRLAALDQANVAYRLKDWLYFHSITWRSINPLVATAYRKLSGAINRDVVGLPNLTLPVRIDSQSVRALRETLKSEYRGNIEELTDLVSAIGARLVLVTQTFTLHFEPAWPFTRDWVTYGEEVAMVERLLTNDGEILAPLSQLLIHSDLMDVLRTQAHLRGLTLVEGITALDADRGAAMASRVHLTPTGNELLAEALAKTLSQ